MEDVMHGLEPPSHVSRMGRPRNIRPRGRAEEADTKAETKHEVPSAPSNAKKGGGNAAWAAHRLGRLTLIAPVKIITDLQSISLFETPSPSPPRMLKHQSNSQKEPKAEARKID